MPKDSDGSWLSRGAKAGIIQTIVAHCIAYVVPVGSTVVTIAIGGISEQPWFFIWISAVVTFGFASIGLVNFHGLMERERVEGKLVFSHVNVGKPIAGSGLSVGIGLVNCADSTIEFEVEDVITQIGNSSTTNKSFGCRIICVPPKGNAHFDDHEIICAPPVGGGHLAANLLFKLNYGKPGQRKYNMKIRKDGALGFDENGILTAHAWNDVV